MTRKKNHQDIKELLAEHIEDVKWITSPEGRDNIDDKGTTRDTVLTGVVQDLMELALKHGIDYRQMILYGVLRFAGEHPGEVHDRLHDIINLALAVPDRPEHSIEPCE